MTCEIIDLYAKRHSFYQINNTLSLSLEKIEYLIRQILKLYPSPFNSQSSRLLLLIGESHKKFWNLTKEALFSSAPVDKQNAISNKIASFAAGFGTILFFYDKDIIRKQEADFPLYAENFENWAFQSNAILQFMIWSAFAEKDIGASLQHYNPLIDTVVRDAFNVPQNWELTAQMPFGGIVNTPAPHSADKADTFLITLR